jgi:hypothetical protein
MRTTLALATLLAFGLAGHARGQASAGAKITGQCQHCQQKQTASGNSSVNQQRMTAQAAPTGNAQLAGAVEQVMMLVPQQTSEGQQAVFLVPQYAAPYGDIQLVGGHHHHAAAGQPCPPGGQYGPPGGQQGPPNGQYGPPWTGGHAYSYPSDWVHPGQPYSGGHYGYWGGAHRTPGYPRHHKHREYVGPQGPPTAQVAYPYYTVRGPRDFFLDNPPSIGR